MTNAAKIPDVILASILDFESGIRRQECGLNSVLDRFSNMHIQNSTGIYSLWGEPRETDSRKKEKERFSNVSWILKSSNIGRPAQIPNVHSVVNKIN